MKRAFDAFKFENAFSPISHRIIFGISYQDTFNYILSYPLISRYSFISIRKVYRFLDLRSK